MLRSFSRAPSVRTCFLFATQISPKFRPRPACRFFASQSSAKPPSPSSSSRNQFIALLGVGAAAFGGYYILTQGKGDDKKTGGGNSKEKNTLPEGSPFSTRPTVIFVLGGPGAGKGTQCAKLVKDYGFVHLSAGDLLRAERNRKGSEVGELINTYIKEGKIVPMEITIKLLQDAMVASGASRFLIDGFPRKMDQALKFEETVCKSDFILYFECPEEEMLRRLLKRGETSGRVDDNIDSIKKRFETFRDTSYPVIDYYRKLGKVRQISCLNTPDNVYSQVKNVFTDLFKESK